MNFQLQSLLKRVIQAFQSDDSEEAELILNEALKASINSAQPIFEIGISYAKSNRFIEALTIFSCLLPYKKDDLRVPYNMGLIYSLLGMHQHALEAYDMALNIKSDDVEVLINKGSTCNDIKNYALALEILESAIQIREDIPEAWSNKGIALNNFKLYQDPISAYEQAIKLSPNFHEAWSNKSAPLNRLKKYTEALQACDKALTLKPDYAEGWSNKGVTLNELKRYDEAIAHYDKALTLKPDYAEGWSNKGVTLNELKRYDEAIAHYDKALTLKPDYAEGWSNKSAPLNRLKKYTEALQACDKALTLKPDYAEGWSNKGVTLNELKRYDEAIAHYDKALTLKPDYAEGWSNKGVTLNELKRYDEAIAHYDKALTLKPDYAEGWSNKGVTLNELKRYDEAIFCFENALKQCPDIDWVRGDLLHTKMKVCNWLGFSDSLEFISRKVMENESVTAPFPLLALSDDVLLHKISSEIYIQNKYPPSILCGPIIKSLKNQKIRIGYFSADFHNHATGHLIAELFELHDKSRFELFAFSFGPKISDEMSRRIEKSFDQFLEVGGMSDIEIAQLSRGLNINIAIDLKGFTQDSRVDIFSNRAAPIQVNYLGYPGTMGASYIDYIIADKALIPLEFQAYYSEKIVYLPNSYQVNDRTRLISDREFSRRDLGLPEDGFVFCCFNNNYKILPQIFQSWMQILQAVQGSVLWLLEDNPSAADNLKKEAYKKGISPERLIFAKRTMASEHLARHRLADLFLDTWPCNAHTTASDALWAQLPVLTLMGKSFASRVAASLLNAIELPELVVGTQEEYVDLAIELAKDRGKLASIKRKLEDNRMITPLFDTPLFAKNIEGAYVKMYERFQEGLPPDHIDVR